ncbi:MAG TPA: ATP-binding protein [Candidatus Thermoplasmatota archaeon]|jgi:PAS domain S-box-containing protein|nr:ATP-binding protein [Candidatus Thermoplasmatota archaeon]
MPGEARLPEAPAPFVPSASDDRDALRLTTQRLRALIDHLQSGLLVEDEHRNIVHVNHEFLKIFGIPLQPEQMVGMNCSQAAEQSKGMFTDPTTFVARITDILAQRQLAKGDEMTLVDGRYLERDYVPILLDGQFRGHYWHYRDVTERMRDQAEIRELNAQLQQRVEQLATANLELERMAQARAQFVSAIAHELGNAMMPVKTHLFMLRKGREAANHDAQQTAMQVMGRNVDRLSLLVEDLLDASRLHAGRLSVHVRPVDLNKLVEESVQAFEEQAKERGVRLELRLAPDLHLPADARRVVQVMFNLLSNALKFTPLGGAVTVTTELDGRFARVAVADTGAGLAPEGIPKLFQPFTQAHDPAAVKGTGLGLFICRGIIEQHGGAIGCSSEGPGRGATFSFTLPLEGPPAIHAGNPPSRN